MYRYCSLPKDLEEMIEAGGDALGRIMNLVKKRCPCAVMDEFPDDTVLVEPRAYRDFFD